MSVSDSQGRTQLGLDHHSQHLTSLDWPLLLRQQREQELVQELVQEVVQEVVQELVQEVVQELVQEPGLQTVQGPTIQQPGQDRSLDAHDLSKSSADSQALWKGRGHPVPGRQRLSRCA